MDLTDQLSPKNESYSLCSPKNRDKEFENRFKSIGEASIRFNEERERANN